MSAISEDIYGSAIENMELTVGNFFGRTVNPPGDAFAAKPSLGPSSSIQMLRMLGRRVMASAYRSMKLETVSVNKPSRLPTLSITTAGQNSSMIRLTGENRTLRRPSTETS